MRKLGTIAGVLALGASLSGCWVQIGNAPGRAYWNADETTITAANVGGGLTPKWDTDLGGSFTSPASFGNAVFVTGGSHARRLNATTGAVEWDHGPLTVPDPNGQPLNVSLGAPLHDGGKVYVPYSWGFFSADGGGVYTFDAGSGTLLDDHAGIEGLDLALAGGTRALRGADVLGTSGTTVSDITWKYHPVIPHSSFANQPPYPGGFAVVGERIAWSLGTKAFVYSAACPPLSSGTDFCAPDFQTELGGNPSGGPAAIGSDHAVYADDTGTVSVVDLTTGAIAWTGETGVAITTHPAVAGDSILVGTIDGRVVAFPAAGCGATTCPPSWSSAVGGAPVGPVTVGGDVAYVTTNGGDVVALARDGCGSATCTPLTTVHANAAPGATVVVDGGRALVRTATGHLVAYGLPN
jgi:hypothetical protein